MLVDPSTDAPIAHTVTDSIGTFDLKASAGFYQIAAVRDGFGSTLSAPLNLVNGERMTIRIPMAVDGNTKHRIGVLEHVRPSAQQNLSSTDNQTQFFSGFDTRRESSAPGERFLRSDFERSGVTTLGEFLQRVGGVSVRDPGSAASIDMSRSLVRSSGMLANSVASCHVGWFVDGHRMDYGNVIDPSTDVLGRMQLDNIEALEVFRGLSEMPAEFASPELRCGAIAIWTRRF